MAEDEPLGRTTIRDAQEMSMSPHVLFRLGAVLLGVFALMVGPVAPADAAVRLQWVMVNDPVTTELFARPGARAALQRAADAWTSRLGDSLEARTIASPEKWILPFDPTTGTGSAPLSRFVGPLLDGRGALPIPTDTIVVVVGAHQARADPLNHGGSLYSFSDITRPNQKTVDKRGTAHAVPYVGALSFSNDKNWSFGNPGPGDFVAAAEHELGHVLGLINGNVDWDPLTRNQRYFVGRNAVAAYQALGGVIDAAHPGVPLDIQTPGHWAPSPGDPRAPGQPAVGLLQTRAGAAIRATMQEQARTRLTTLDFAALQDLGWRVRPG
jgi:hypothetical protein